MRGAPTSISKCESLDTWHIQNYTSARGNMAGKTRTGKTRCVKDWNITCLQAGNIMYCGLTVACNAALRARHCLFCVRHFSFYLGYFLASFGQCAGSHVWRLRTRREQKNVFSGIPQSVRLRYASCPSLSSKTNNNCIVMLVTYKYYKVSIFPSRALQVTHQKQTNVKTKKQKTGRSPHSTTHCKWTQHSQCQKQLLPSLSHPLERRPVRALLSEVFIPRVEVAVEVNKRHRPELLMDSLKDTHPSTQPWKTHINEWRKYQSASECTRSDVSQVLRCCY